MEEGPASRSPIKTVSSQNVTADIKQIKFDLLIFINCSKLLLRPSSDNTLFTNTNTSILSRCVCVEYTRLYLRNYAWTSSRKGLIIFLLPLERGMMKRLNANNAITATCYLIRINKSQINNVTSRKHRRRDSNFPTESSMRRHVRVYIWRAGDIIRGQLNRTPSAVTQQCEWFEVSRRSAPAVSSSTSSFRLARRFQRASYVNGIPILRRHYSEIAYRPVIAPQLFA